MGVGTGGRPVTSTSGGMGAVYAWWILVSLIAGVALGIGIAAYVRAINAVGPVGPNGTCPASCFSPIITIGNVTTGAPGSNVTVVNAGNETNVVLNISIPAGETGPNGTAGANGTAVPIGYAQFIYTTQAPNNGCDAPSTPSSAATCVFTVNSSIYNSIPSTIVASAGLGGTVWTLGAGTYEIHYEMSFGSAGSVAIFTGSAVGALTADTNTLAGSTTATTWIHGTALLNVGSTIIIGVGNYVGNSAIVTAGTAAGFYVIRVTFIKIA